MKHEIKTILVTGGLGFIGSNFIRSVLSKYEIISIDKLSYGSNVLNLEDLENENNYRFIKGDINDEEMLKELIQGVDAVINFAAETHVDRSISDAKPFLVSNVIGVQSLLEAVRKTKKDTRMVQIGTDEEYGDSIDKSFNENDRLAPSSPYAATKASASMLIAAYHRTYGLDVVMTRCTNNFGPYQFPEKLIPKAILRAKMNLKIPIYGTGNNKRDWIYVMDHCEAVEQVMLSGEQGQIYNIGAGNELTNLQVVNSILKILDKPSDLIEFVQDRPGHDIRYSLDCSKIREKLGWKARHSFNDSLKHTVQWYVENENWYRSLLTEQILHPTPWKLSW
ncbi:MAG: dTDP-glucose 4,6-dehydratase [Nitrososphaerales archaeon]